MRVVVGDPHLVEGAVAEQVSPFHEARPGRPAARPLRVRQEEQVELRVAVRLATREHVGRDAHALR